MQGNDELAARLQAVVQRSVDRETRYVVPAGDVKALTKYIQGLSGYQPVDPVDVGEHRKKFRRALEEAAQRILELEKDRESEAYEAARYIVLANRVYWFAGFVSPQQRQIVTDVKDYLDDQLKKGNAQVQECQLRLEDRRDRSGQKAA